MIIEFPREGDIPLGESNDNRGDFDNKTDEELLALRARYKKFEKSIFAESWQRPSLGRFQETCAALCLALDLATKEEDKDMVYCPWLFEAFNTLQSRIIKIPEVIPKGDAYYKWIAEIREVVEGTCTAFGCFGDYLVRYVTAVYPEGTDSPHDFIKVVRSELNSFFKIGESKNKEPFVTAAFELLYGHDERGYPKLKKEVLGKLTQACQTLGWPAKIRTKEDMPTIIPNITNDELCSLFGIKLPPQEEREKIDRQIEAERAQVDLVAAFEKAEKFFAAEDWFKHPGLAIAMWRICRRASAIGKKANGYHEYYYNKSSEGPVQPLSEDLRGDRQDDLVPLIKAFAFAFRREMSGITSLSYKLEELIPSMWNLNGAIESLLYFMDKLPHDRHLNAARRLFGEWYEILSCIIREQIKPSAASSVMVDKIDEFCTELIAASDVLNERESVLHDKRAFQEVSPAPQYSLEVANYEEILAILRNAGATMERTPNSYMSLKEDGLRNVLLTALNSSFKGSATGEAFRNNGKTDICIEAENRAAFVAECKMWTGEKEVASAIAQLDSYLTWRDCKTALIYFVRRRDFLSVTKKMEGVLRRRDNISQVSMLDTNEYKCFLASMSSPGQMKEVRVLMFNLSTVSAGGDSCDTVEGCTNGDATER